MQYPTCLLNHIIYLCFQVLWTCTPRSFCSPIHLRTLSFMVHVLASLILPNTPPLSGATQCYHSIRLSFTLSASLPVFRSSILVIMPPTSKCKLFTYITKSKCHNIDICGTPRHRYSITKATPSIILGISYWPVLVSYRSYTFGQISCMDPCWPPY